MARDDLKVFISRRNSTCDECGEQLGRHAWITLQRGKGALCLTTIAEHACRKYSGRVGRSAAAKALDEEAVRLAVTAHARHAETSYDLLLIRGVDRREARASVQPLVADVLRRWEEGEP